MPADAAIGVQTPVSTRFNEERSRAKRAYHPAPLLSLSASSRAHALLLQAPGASGTGSRLSEVDKYLLLGTPADGERQQSRLHRALAHRAAGLEMGAAERWLGSATLGSDRRR